MARQLDFVLFDPVSDTRIAWPIGDDGYFGITVKRGMADLINAVARKTNRSPLQVMTGEDAKRFVIRIEPRGKGEHQ